MADKATPGRSTGSRRSVGDVALGLLKRFWLPLILVVAAIIFIAQNTQHVQVRFLVFSIGSWQWLIITVVAVGGLIAGWVLGRNGARKGSRQ
ncbi:lipopolysaccharide assembly protein LapA domain-containing protein [Gordonia sp. DT30]|uniref:lipopolysaccharide assembly protein LapA domain-containing protein n=1 Tax=unclassified Gordonia (in: high G+C Gram-positive bacteria) TaxID=2657482 RepID=UPI003CE7E998